MAEPLSQDAETTRGAPNDVVDLLPPRTETDIAKLLRILLYSHGNIPRARALALFQNRVTYSAIKLWRHGHRKPPRWAVDILQLLAAQHARETLAIAERLTPHKDRGEYGARVLRRHNAKRAHDKMHPL